MHKPPSLPALLVKAVHTWIHTERLKDMKHQNSAHHTPLHEFVPWLTESHWDVVTEEKEERHSVTSAVVRAWGWRSYFCYGTHSWVKAVCSSPRVLSQGLYRSHALSLLFFLAYFTVHVPRNVPFLVKLCKVTLSLSSASDIHNLHDTNSNLRRMNRSIAEHAHDSQIHFQTANTFWHIVSFLIIMS